MNPIVERIQNLFIQNHAIPAQVFYNLGIPKNALSIWKTGKAKPSTDAIIKIASYFNVSTDFLLTGKTHSSELCQSEQDLLCSFRSLPDSGKEKVKGYIEGYIAALNDKKK